MLSQGAPHLIIQPITASEGAELNQLLKKIESESHNMLYDPGERTTSDQEQTAFIERMAKNARSTILVARDADQLVGFIAIMGENLNKKFHSRYIAMGVLDEFKGKKIGSRLMEAAIAFCKEQQVTRMELTVVASNERAIKLYQKYGFELEGTKRQSLKIQGKLADEFYMAKIS
jgi:RimJ/RimL family protein N-acetyltransferase